MEVNKKERFTLSIFTENQVGLVNHIAIILMRRKINIDSLTTSESEVKGIYRFTIVVYTLREQILKIVKQIEKIIDVIKTYCYAEDEVFYKEIALYKLKYRTIKNFEKLDTILCQFGAVITHFQEEYIIVEKTGTKEETQSLLKALTDEKYPVIGFVRSGRIALGKDVNNIHAYIKSLVK